MNSPANTLDDNDQEAPHRALCTALLTKAPCCTDTSKSDTSEPPRNWKGSNVDEQMLHSDKIAMNNKIVLRTYKVNHLTEEINLMNPLHNYKAWT